MAPRNFTYFTLEDLNNRVTVTEEINKRIMTDNEVYYANVKLLKSELLSRSKKLKLYKTLIRPIDS